MEGSYLIRYLSGLSIYFGPELSGAALSRSISSLLATGEKSAISFEGGALGAVAPAL